MAYHSKVADHYNQEYRQH